MTTRTSPRPIAHAAQPDGHPGPSLPGADYLVDAMERTVLFLDVLRQRGNRYAEQADGVTPDLLKFRHELVLDGRDLPRPCNYALLHILEPDGVQLDPASRPVVVVDPRAGHGPGIGGFKLDSEVGVAVRSGHPVYFVTFRPQPEEGQTLLDIGMAEARFLEAVAARHPQCSQRPLVIGNCQAGWALAALASLRPDLFGPLILVGSPLSYWAGSAQMNPMRYSGAVLGGAWLAALGADLGGDRFDGAHLVKNFENLNPAHNLWSRHYKLWSEVDTEAERFLDFERWWGGFFRMTGGEYESIVENLFVGNRLARGEVELEGYRVDLRNIETPIVVFASWGDNITPPPQALNWIIDTWGDERAIAAAGRVIVYVLHETVGHLGIFVGTDVARKEHDQIVQSLDVMEHLPPGLYEMTLRRKSRRRDAGDEFEPEGFAVRFEHRRMDDLRAINPEGRDEEQLFSTVAKLSDINLACYRTWVRPWLRPLASRGMADALLPLHPMRLERQALSDKHPLAPLIAAWAEQVRANRHALPPDHPALPFERALSSWIEFGLDLYRDLRDQAAVQFARLAFGPLGIGAWLPPDPPLEQVAVARAQLEIAAARRDALQRVAEGGFPQAVCRIVLAAMAGEGAFERRGLRLARRLAELPAADGATTLSVTDWLRLTRDQARLLAVARDEALDALAQMLPAAADRVSALAVAVAVLTLDAHPAPPRSTVLEDLANALRVDLAQAVDRAVELRAAARQSPAWALPPASPRRKTA